MSHFIRLICCGFIILALNISQASASNNLIARSVEIDDFIRIFFYCKQPVKFNPYFKDDSLHITFDKTFSTDLKEVYGHTDITSSTTSEDGKTISFKLSGSQYAVRKFIGEEFVGVDIIKKYQSQSAQNNTQPVPKASTPAQPANIDQQEQQPIFDIAQEARKISNQEQEQKIATPNKEDILANLIRKFELMAEEQEAPSEVLNANEEIPNPQITEADADYIKEDLFISNLDDEYELDDEVVNDNNTNNFSIHNYNVYTKIIFPWQEQVAAAVFTRGRYLWIVFDKYQKINIDNIVQANTEYFSEAEQMHHKYYTVARFALNDAFNVAAYKVQENWIIALVEEPVRPINEIEISTSVTELQGSVMTVASEHKLHPLRLIDPEVGDEMVILPFTAAHTAMERVRKYTDFSLLKTTQGGSVQISADNVNFDVVRKGIEIAGPTNRLAGSAQSALRELQEREKEERLRAERLKQKGGELTMLKFKAWLQGGIKSFVKDKNDLQWTITEADWSDKGPFRLNLARFYLAHSLYEESVGVIRMLRASDEKYAEETDVKIVEAAGLYLSRKYVEAMDVLDSIDTSNLEDREKAEIKFWRSASNIQFDNLIEMDKFVTKNPLDKKTKEEKELEGKDEVGNTRLMLDTSSRLLKIIRKMDPEFINADEIQKLESTARFVAGHYHEAIKRFEESDLYRSGDVFEAEEDRLWWSISDARKEEIVDLEFIENIDSFLQYYPDHIYNDFAMLALENRLKKDDLVVAEEIIASFKDEDRTIHANSIKFLTGLFYAKDEETEKAISTWESLLDNVFDPLNRARSQFALTVFLLDKQKIDQKEAIKRLTSLRSLWRGGILEFSILNMLGEFQMAEKNYMDGFDLWRNAISAFPGSDEALIVARKMSDKFVQIFSQGEADDMSRLDALTLYYEFRELTPIGKLGDEMVSRLADRLIEVDLLDRAAALLTHQVRFRLIGADKDTASLKLVKVHLMNRNPQKALDVLNATQNTNMNEENSKERTYLKARSLLELGRINKVLGILRGDESHSASFLRAEVYWRNRVWRKVVEELETAFRDIRREEKMLTQQQMDNLLRLSVAYALTGRNKRLHVLYEDFVEFVPESKRKDIFTFVSTDNGPVDFRNLEHTVEFKNMKNFLGNYLESESRPSAPL